MRTIIANAELATESGLQRGHVLVVDDLISDISYAPTPPWGDARTIDAKGALLMPGVIDEHVHFRDPGLTHKADFATESRAAAAGGVTTCFDMPNVVPPTVSIADWEQKMRRASDASVVNYSCFYGASGENTHTFSSLDPRLTCGIKVFMGATTGGMRTDDPEVLRTIFANAPLPIMTHCEDSRIIDQNAAEARTRCANGEAPIAWHPLIRSREACIESTALAVRLAVETGARLHVAHLSTREEVQMLADLTTDNVTGEACVAHLVFCDSDYDALGARIKCNPAIKTAADREALRKAVASSTSRVTTIATDHAPHLLSEKEGGALRAASGMPSVQFSLPAMLTLADQGVLPLMRAIQLMTSAPARLFAVERRGFLRQGYKADLTLVRHERWTVQPSDIVSRCGWSPFEGMEFSWRVAMTMCNGHMVYDGTNIDDSQRGEAVTFSR